MFYCNLAVIGVIDLRFVCFWTLEKVFLD